MKIQKFEDLNIWKSSLKLTKEIYGTTSVGKFAKDYGLRDQIQRAVVSISSNIVEGFEKNNNNEFIRFLKIAKGSTGETRNQMHIALAIGYVTQADFEGITNDLEILSGQIGAFISYLEGKRKNNEFIPTKP
jgi:four helix bundle protein